MRNEEVGVLLNREYSFTKSLSLQDMCPKVISEGPFCSLKGLRAILYGLVLTKFGPATDSSVSVSDKKELASIYENLHVL